MAMEFLNEVFKCSVKTGSIDNDNFPDSGDIGVRSISDLYINHDDSQTLGYAQIQKLNSLLEGLEVTGKCSFSIYPGRDFYCDPKVFKCKKLVFFSDSAAWVTREILLQFEVPQLKIFNCPFSVEDLVSCVTQWFKSDNKKSEYWFICLRDSQISMEKFQTEELNPSPFSERNRVPSSQSFVGIDFTKGLEIVRHDGLQATIHINREDFLFYIWHDQSAITQS